MIIKAKKLKHFKRWLGSYESPARLLVEDAKFCFPKTSLTGFSRLLP